MESPTPEGKSNKSGGINLTAVVIAVILCAAGLGAAGDLGSAVAGACSAGGAITGRVTVNSLPSPSPPLLRLTMASRGIER